MRTRKKKHSLTLLEIMIVIVLIGLIGSVIGFNMKGSLDEGKAFKSRQAIDQIKDILMLEVAQGTSIEEVVQDPKKYLANSGLVKNPEKYLKDGWNNDFIITVSGRSRDEIKVTSEKLKAYDRKKNEKLGKKNDDSEEEE